MTDKLRDAAQMALEALEKFARFQRMMMDGPDESDKLLAEDYAEAAFLQGAQAIPALRAALAEQQEPVAFQAREIGEGDWFQIPLTEFQRIRGVIESAHMDYRWVYTAPEAPQPKAEPLPRMEVTGIGDEGLLDVVRQRHFGGNP